MLWLRSRMTPNVAKFNENFFSPHSIPETLPFFGPPLYFLSLPPTSLAAGSDFFAAVLLANH